MFTIKSNYLKLLNIILNNNKNKISLYKNIWNLESMIQYYEII